MRTLVLLLTFVGTASGAEPPPVKAPPPVKGFVAPALPTDSNQPAPAGYHWIKRGDAPWKLERVAPGVAVPKGSTFPAGRNIDGHQCPACGRSQYTVDGFNRDGTHRHRCPVDGTVWSH